MGSVPFRSVIIPPDVVRYNCNQKVPIFISDDHNFRETRGRYILLGEDLLG